MYKKIFKISIIILLFSSLVGCFSPAILETQPNCQLVTKELKLTLSEEGTQALLGGIMQGLLEPSDSCYSPECILLAPLGLLAISVTSIIVSGSIVVVGNTVHWIEKQGMCHNSTIRSVVTNLVNSIQAVGGKGVKSAKELSTWFKQNLQITF
ncbi:hypothetical protein QUF74_07905 [Candidatus Halobeggiatoa sp. HSG11]|nr:hypothetical protein [Candidatus Halobeggiatoa sp. HSG11]